MEDIIDSIPGGSGMNKVKMIKRMGVLSVAKVSAVTLAAMGLFIVLIVMLFGSLIGGAFGMMGEAGITAVIAAPIVYGILGFIFGALYAFIYNVSAGVVGGIEIELEDVR